MWISKTDYSALVEMKWEAEALRRQITRMEAERQRLDEDRERLLSIILALRERGAEAPLGVLDKEEFGSYTFEDVEMETVVVPDEVLVPEPRLEDGPDQSLLDDLAQALRLQR